MRDLSLGVMMQLWRFNILEAAISHSRSHFFLYISVDLKCFCPAVSGQQCEVAQTLGRLETAVKVQVSQPSPSAFWAHGLDGNFLCTP